MRVWGCGAGRDRLKDPGVQLKNGRHTGYLKHYQRTINFIVHHVLLVATLATAFPALLDVLDLLPVKTARGIHFQSN